jgi:hypothetical protein
VLSQLEQRSLELKFSDLKTTGYNHSEFKNIVKNAWEIPIGFTDSAKAIIAKLNNLRRAIKLWAKISSMSQELNTAGQFSGGVIGQS